MFWAGFKPRLHEFNPRTPRLKCHEHQGLQDMQASVQDVYMGKPISVCDVVSLALEEKQR